MATDRPAAARPRTASNLGGTKIGAARVPGGVILDRRQIATPRAPSFEPILEAMVRLVDGWNVVAVQDGPLCGCGRRGCLEVVAAGPALVQPASRLFGRPTSAAELSPLRPTTVMPPAWVPAAHRGGRWSRA